MDSLTELYCLLDDFLADWQEDVLKRSAGLLTTEAVARKRHREGMLSISELMTLMVLFHQCRYRQFKIFYTDYVKRFLGKEFPSLPSYQRMVELMPRCLEPLCAFFEWIKGRSTGIAIVDSTPLAVCDNLRIKRHRVFREEAKHSKTSTGWFFGFKLHVLINHKGELLSIKFTEGNCDDRKPVLELCKNIHGILLADKGYISASLKKNLAAQGITLLNKVRKNMKPVERTRFEKILMRSRSVIETVFNELKNLCQIEHTRHRSKLNFSVNLISGIVAYCLQTKKPHINVCSTAPVPQ